ncbi:MAG: hypothetical protein GEU97_03055 [Actinophytocola sp.]|nr:hypothetical protein [Actinophytocola sp.]
MDAHVEDAALDPRASGSPLRMHVGIAEMPRLEHHDTVAMELAPSVRDDDPRSPRFEAEETIELRGSRSGKR